MLRMRIPSVVLLLAPTSLPLPVLLYMHTKTELPVLLMEVLHVQQQMQPPKRLLLTSTAQRLLQQLRLHLQTHRLRLVLFRYLRCVLLCNVWRALLSYSGDFHQSAHTNVFFHQGSLFVAWLPGLALERFPAACSCAFLFGCMFLSWHGRHAYSLGPCGSTEHWWDESDAESMYRRASICVLWFPCLCRQAMIADPL